jgi:hypothetical protein
LNLRFGPFLPGQRRFGLWRSTPGLLVATPSGASTLAGETLKEIWKKSCFFFLVCLTENEINFIFDPKNCITLVSVVPAFQSRTSSMPKTPTPWKFQDLLFLILRRSQV